MFKKLKFSENCLHMPPLDSSEGGHCFFFQFWPPGELFVMWFPEKSAIGGGVKRGGVLGDIMVNHKNAVEIFFFFISAFKCTFGPIHGL